MMSAHMWTVLVVDDNADTRRMFLRALKLGDFQAMEAANGEAAIAMLDGDPCPDLVLLDLSMPKMDGAEFIRLLRLHAKCAKTKVAIVSGWDNLAGKARELGADGYISKPVNLIELHREATRIILGPK